jgi:hypothetical protein
MSRWSWQRAVVVDGKVVAPPIEAATELEPQPGDLVIRAFVLCCDRNAVLQMSVHVSACSPTGSTKGAGVRDASCPVG